MEINPKNLSVAEGFGARFAINLLPPERRKDIKNAISQRLTLFYGKALMALLLLLAAEMLALVVATRIETKALQQEGDAGRSAQEGFAELQKQARVASGRLGAINTFFNDHRPLTPLIENIVSVVPAGITLNGIHVKSADRTVEIMGHTQTRELLLALERALKASPDIASVEVPLPSLLKASDADFAVVVHVK